MSKSDLLYSDPLAAAVAAVTAAVATAATAATATAVMLLSLSALAAAVDRQRHRWCSCWRAAAGGEGGSSLAH